MGRKVYFPMHLGSGNRGCEGIIRGIIGIMKWPTNEVVLIERDIENYNTDQSFSLDTLGKLRVPSIHGTGARLIYIILRCLRKFGICKEKTAIYPYIQVFREIHAGDLVCMTGGDLYCYASTVLLNKVINNYAKKRGAKTALVGCSLDESLLNESVLSDLKNYILIICRESISFNMLVERNITNIHMIPDPAFILAPQKCNLPKIFIKHNVVGLNISTFVNQGSRMDTLFMENIDKLIDYILNQLKFNILLIPHVFWREQNDLVLSQLIKKRYENDDRVELCINENLNYCQIRYIISKCRFFIGARTHSIISAYSTYVPALALGYSTKSVGIAKDIGLPAYMVVDSQHLNSPDDILNAFKQMVNEELLIKKIYSVNMPAYCARVMSLHEILTKC